MSTIDNKRIAKNTMFLYLRMGLTIIVNLYAVRVIWNVLGIDNYGIYNVVGGIVLMFQFLNSAMVASSQRFISYELGTGNIDRLKKVFSVSVRVHYMLAVIIVILAETVGLWFLNSKLNIPADRMFAANCVYQCTIASFFVNVISVPYNACLVAHEHMKIYGYYGILSVVLKLVIVYLLLIIPLDKLIVYALLILCVDVFMRLLYQFYCRKHFVECRYIKMKDKKLIKDMFSFAGWSFLGNMGISFKDQGLNIILNMFFNVAMNAAKGIANQAVNTLNSFAGNFIMALNPQITKSYASGDTIGMISLMTRGCKFSFLLLSVIVLPIMVCCKELLHLWLGDIEDITIGFLRWMLLLSLIESMVGPVTTALQATGNIKRFQIVIAVIMLTCLPASWIWLNIDIYPFAVVIIPLIASIIALLARLFLLREQIPFSLGKFFKLTVLRCYPVSAISYVLCNLLYTVSFFSCGLFGVSVFLVSSAFICAAVAVFAFDTAERKYAIRIISSKLHIINS